MHLGPYRSVVDPGGGDVVTGGVIQVTTGHGAGAAPDVIAVMGVSQIRYNGKTLALTRPPFQVHIDPFLPRSVNVTLTGVVETLLRPRVDVRVRIGFRPSNSQAERVQVDNCWQWAQQGNQFLVILDSAHNVNTTLSASASALATSLTVANASGITAARVYALVSGPNYQIVRVTNVSGTTITIADALDYAFPSGCVFRDWLLWNGIVTDADARAPIDDMYDDQGAKNFFNWFLEFVETP